MRGNSYRLASVPSAEGMAAKSPMLKSQELDRQSRPERLEKESAVEDVRAPVEVRTLPTRTQYHRLISLN